ncbi:cobyrinate a,c-diamide synthase [Desulfovibrio sp. OttesenSCG-928-A18]|nr:cobyrinate a,c-diamide synthase [Desulfovibrio sp. OttesenSCG-928-A18]
MATPSIVISGLSGGSGKTMLSLGLARAFVNQGLRVRACKKGPDYIDAAWLALAARAPKANLDPFFTPGPGLRQQFLAACAGYDLALVEGNRGLFDGLDISGSCSTAELARIIDAPVLLVVDCTKMTRTVAALVKGCIDFEPGLRIGGIVLNRTGNQRHQSLTQRAVEELAGLPVLGILPRRSTPFINERHMGLSGLDEHADADQALDGLARYISAHVNLEAVLELAAPRPAKAGRAHPEELFTAADNEACAPPPTRKAASRSRTVRIGYVRDAAFWFYYQENLDALRRLGAELLPLSLLSPEAWPAIDGLYMGGGLPELHLEALSANSGALRHVADLSRSGLPIYAECGGFIYLCAEIRLHDRSRPMAGVFPHSIEFCPKPQGLGYVEATVVRQNPFYPVGLRLRGHEFHFTRNIPPPAEPGTQPGEKAPPGKGGDDMRPDEAAYILELARGSGMQKSAAGALDGLCVNNTFAAYTHIYAPAVPQWAESFVSLCRQVSARISHE